MRICVLTQYYKPEMGAPQNRLYEMCEGLRSNGAEVFIVTGMPNYPTGRIFDEYRGRVFKKEMVDGMEVRRYWLYASNTKRVLPRLWNMLSFSFMALFSMCYMRKRNLDFLIVESPPLTLGVSGFLLAKLSKTQLVLNVSDLWPLSARELGAIDGEGSLYKFLERVERFLYRKAVLCMGQSQEIVDYMAAHGATNTYLFRNGVDPTRFLTVSRSIDIGKTMGEAKRIKIVYAGLLGFAQGILGICKNINFTQLCAEFHIYGAGGEQMEIEDYLRSNTDKGIYYHGKVDRDEIPFVLQNADCTLVPLVKNIFGAVPSKIYESMAAGVPILFFGDGEGKLIVETNNLGWVCPPLDYNALNRNIEYISKHQNELKFKKDNCIKCANDKFNRPKQVKDLYRQLHKLI